VLPQLPSPRKASKVGREGVQGSFWTVSDEIYTVILAPTCKRGETWGIYSSQNDPEHHYDNVEFKAMHTILNSDTFFGC
jgi:hypothetical protein